MTKDTELHFEPGAEPGDVLTRHYEGRKIVVAVEADGFHFGSRTYASLSKVAMHVTGVSTNGPLWFGLRKKRPARAQATTTTASRPLMPIPRPRLPDVQAHYRRFWP